MVHRATLLGFATIAVLTHHLDPVAYRDGDTSSFRATAYGAVCNGDPKSDDGTGIRAAVSAARSTGADIMLPSGTCNVAGTINLKTNGVVLIGKGTHATTINCTGMGTADCIVIGGMGVQVYGGGLRDLTITAPSRTGGSCIDIDTAAQVLVSRVNLLNCHNGVYDTITNTIALEDMMIVGISGTYGIKWYSPANSTQRSDVLQMTRVTMNAGFSGADCLDWDGMAATLRLTNVGFLECNYGLRVFNSAASSSYFPEFLFATDLEIEGATSASVRIDGGADFHFVNSDLYNHHGENGQGGADTDCFIVNPDARASITRNIWVTGGRIGGCNDRGANLNAQEIHFTGVNFTSISEAGRGDYPVIEIGADAEQVDLIGISTYQYGDAINASYVVTTDSGASRVTVQADCQGVVSGCVNNAGRISHLAVLPGFLPNGSVSPLGLGTVPSSDSAIDMLMSAAGSDARIHLVNPNTTLGTQSRLDLATGTASSYTLHTQSDGRTPGYAITTGRGDTGGITIDASAASSAPLTLKVGSTGQIVPRGKLNFGSVSGGGSASKYVCVDSSNDVVLSSLPC